jgi:hypothetical protein
MVKNAESYRSSLPLVARYTQVVETIKRAQNGKMELCHFV